MMGDLLNFEKEALLDALNENSLTICSKGIIIDRLLLNLVETFCNACHLVLVIGADASEESSIIAQLEERHANDNDEETDFMLPKIISSDSMAATNRSTLYLSGGVIFITTRLLVVDMLKCRVPFESLSGIIVMNAHRVIKDCQLSFILRLYRLSNKTGFITALSQSPSSFHGSFAQLERIMKQLFVDKLFLWPRFHATICDSLATQKAPNVIEIRIQMTSMMKQIQFAIIDLISMCIKELTSMNSFIYSNTIDVSSNNDDNSINTMNVIANNFNRIIRANLDSVWYQLSSKARRLIRDIQLLKSLLFHLTELDAVSFFGEMKHIRDNVSPDCNPSDWLFWAPSETLFTLSQKRVFLSDEESKRKYRIEINPKLETLNNLLGEIEEKHNYLKRIKNNEEHVDCDDNDDGVIDIIIVVENRYSIKQIELFRDKGHDVIIEELRHKCEMLLEKKNFTLIRKKDSKQSPVVADGDGEFYDDQLTLTQIMGKVEDHELSIIRKHNRLHLHYYEWSAETNCGLGLKRLLNTLQPQYVILYEPEMSCIRQIELYQALRSNPDTVPIEVYFFLFDGSAEEQRYLRNLQVEKESFEKLIEEKSRLAKGKNVDETNDYLIRGKPSLFHPEEISASSSRSGGRNPPVAETSTRLVLVDLREFRSSLPSFIHKIGIELEPVTLEIGDYMITPDCCIERKSISDLIGSLNSGRLYSQAQIMTRYYKRCLLLIEFEDHKSFNFKARYWGCAQNNTGLNSKPSPLLQLVVLTIHFPLMRIIWSPSPNFTADIIDELKKGKDEPNKDTDIIRVSTEASQLPVEYITDRYDIELKEFLLHLPGVTTQNVYAIMNNCTTVIDLIEKSVEELTELLSSTHHAELLHRALHGNVVAEQDQDQHSNRLNLKKAKPFSYVRRKKPLK